MTEEEFEAFLDRIGEAEFDKLTLPSFLDMLWASQSEAGRGRGTEGPRYPAEKEAG
jgi:hypothetical protein